MGGQGSPAWAGGVGGHGARWLRAQQAGGAPTAWEPTAHPTLHRRRLGGRAGGLQPKPLLGVTSWSALKTSKDGGPASLWSKAAPLPTWMSFFLPSASPRPEALAQHSNLRAHIRRARTHRFRETHTWHELMDLGSEQATLTPPLLLTDCLWEETATSRSFHSPWWV